MSDSHALARRLLSQLEDALETIDHPMLFEPVHSRKVAMDRAVALFAEILDQEGVGVVSEDRHT